MPVGAPHFQVSIDAMQAAVQIQSLCVLVPAFVTVTVPSLRLAERIGYDRDWISGE